MPKFTVAELAKRYGIARTSIYDRMKNGSISFEIDNKNRKVIDLSEMQRVYGTPNSNPTSKADSKLTENTTIDLYKQIIEELKRDKEVSEERERRMYKEIEKLNDKIDNLTLALGYTSKEVQADINPDITFEQFRATEIEQEPIQSKNDYQVNKANKKTLFTRFERGVKEFFK